MERLLRGREEAALSDYGRMIRVDVGATRVHGTQIQILTGTGTQEKAQTWLWVEYCNDIPAHVLTTSTEESLSCTAEPISGLIMLGVAEVPRKK